VVVTSTATELNLLTGITTLSGSNTGDQSASDFNHDDLSSITGTAAQYNHPTDANMTVLNNTSNSNSGDQAAGDFSHGSLADLSTGADHSYIDQDVTSASTPTFTNTNFSEATDKNYVTDAQQTVIIATSGANTGDEVAADLTTSGVIEIATAAETTTGTDATRSVSPDGLAGSDYGKRVVGILVTDPGGDVLETGDLKAYFRAPAVMSGWNLVAITGSVSTVSSSGVVNVMLRNVTQTADILSTALTIDASEKDSSTAAAAAVIDTGEDDLTTADQIAVDIDGAGTDTLGLYIELTYQLP